MVGLDDRHEVAHQTHSRISESEELRHYAQFYLCVMGVSGVYRVFREFKSPKTSSRRFGAQFHVDKEGIGAPWVSAITYTPLSIFLGCGQEAE